MVEGLDVLDNLQTTQPVKSADIDNLMTLGNKWADEWNPNLSYIKTARIRQTDDSAQKPGDETAPEDDKQEL